VHGDPGGDLVMPSEVIFKENIPQARLPMEDP